MRNEINTAREKLDSIAEKMPNSGYIYPPNVPLTVELEPVPSLSIHLLVIESQI